MYVYTEQDFSIIAVKKRPSYGRASIILTILTNTIRAGQLGGTLVTRNAMKKGNAWRNIWYTWLDWLFVAT